MHACIHQCIQRTEMFLFYAMDLRPLWALRAHACMLLRPAAAAAAACMHACSSNSRSKGLSCMQRSELGIPQVLPFCFRFKDNLLPRLSRLISKREEMQKKDLLEALLCLRDAITKPVCNSFSLFVCLFVCFVCLFIYLFTYFFICFLRLFAYNYFVS